MSLGFRNGFMTLNLVPRAFPWEKHWEQGLHDTCAYEIESGIPVQQVPVLNMRNRKMVECYSLIWKKQISTIQEG